MFSSNKPYTAITVQINRLSSEQYEADDMSGVPDLIEVIRIQSGGPTEAARAIRKKLKYGSVHQQLRALTLLDGLIENAGPRFQRSFADEMLLERLRVCATEQMSDPRVKRRCQGLFQYWAKTYAGTAGMERIVGLEKQLPKRKKPVTQQQSKVLRESEPNPNEDPFGTDEEEEENRPAARDASPDRRPSIGTSSVLSPPSITAPIGTSSFLGRKSKKKKQKSRGFSLEKEKPQILQAIASASIASTNLMNSLKLIDREHKRVSEDPDAVRRFEICKQLRRQILRYIQHIESEQWLGSLIQANDALVEALMAFEILDKSIEQDSDSEGEWQDSGKFAAAAESSPPPQPAHPLQQKSLEQGFAGLTFDKKAANKAAAARVVQEGHFNPLSNGRSELPRQDVDDEDEEDDSTEEVEEGNPFADSNAVHTPKTERPGMRWRNV